MSQTLLWGSNMARVLNELLPEAITKRIVITKVGVTEIKLADCAPGHLHSIRVDCLKGTNVDVLLRHEGVILWDGKPMKVKEIQKHDFLGGWEWDKGCVVEFVTIQPRELIVANDPVELVVWLNFVI